MGHYASECPEKKTKGSNGGQWGLCFVINESPVEGHLEQISAHHTEQLNLEAHPEVHSEEKNSSSGSSSFISLARFKQSINPMLIMIPLIQILIGIYCSLMFLSDHINLHQFLLSFMGFL